MVVQRLDSSTEPIECGAAAAQHFLLDKGYLNLNHGKKIRLEDCFIADNDLEVPLVRFPRPFETSNGTIRTPANDSQMSGSVTSIPDC